MLDVTVRRHDQHVLVSDLEDGELFEYADCIWITISAVDVDAPVYAACLDTGALLHQNVIASPLPAGSQVKLTVL